MTEVNSPEPPLKKGTIDVRLRNLTRFDHVSLAAELPEVVEAVVPDDEPEEMEEVDVVELDVVELRRGGAGRGGV